MQIRLNRLKFYAHHGVLPQENEIGASFEVNIILTLSDADAAQALHADRLEHTVNYAEVYKLVRREMQQPSLLIEHVAARLAKRVLHHFNLVRRVEVSVTKCTPPIPGFDGAGVTINYALDRQLVGWDFDGTIADTRYGILRTMQLTLKQVGKPVPDDDAICATIGLPLNQSIASLAGISGRELDEAVATYRRLFITEGEVHTTLFPGIAKALERQHREGYIVAIATSRGHDSTINLCKRLGIAPWIDHVVACEDVIRSKPNPEPVLQLCERTHVDPAHTKVIGDTTFDIEMGLRAEVARVVGVAWGNHSPGRLLHAGAHVVVTDAAAL